MSLPFLQGEGRTNKLRFVVSNYINEFLQQTYRSLQSKLDPHMFGSKLENTIARAAELNFGT